MSLNQIVLIVWVTWPTHSYLVSLFAARHQIYHEFYEFPLIIASLRFKYTQLIATILRSLFS